MPNMASRNSTEVRKNTIKNIRNGKEFAACINRYQAYFLHDVQEYSEVVSSRVINAPFDMEVVSALLNALVKFADSKTAVINMLMVYFNYNYKDLVLNKVKFPDTNEWFRIGVIYPLAIALANLRSQEQYPIHLNKDLFREFVVSIFDIEITAEYPDQAEKIIIHNWDGTKSFEQNFFNIRDCSDMDSYANPNEMTDCLRAFVDYVTNLYNPNAGPEYQIRYIRDLYQRYLECKNQSSFSGIIANYEKNFVSEEDEFDLIRADALWAVNWFFDSFPKIVMKTTTDAKANERYEIEEKYADALGRVTRELVKIYKKDLPPENCNPTIKSFLANIIRRTAEMRKDEHTISRALGLMDMVVDNWSNYISEYDNPIFRVPELTLEPDTEDQIPDYVEEAYDRRSSKLQSAQTAIYHAYKNYKNAEEKVDSQITKMCQAAKRLAIGDARTEIIEGKKFSAIGLLKSALATAAIFSFGPLKGLIALVVRYALKKKTTMSERRKIILEMQVELDMINEKIEDAKGDGNRKAKYALMRTKAELEAALGKIKYGAEVDQRNLEGAKAALSRRIGG